MGTLLSCAGDENSTVNNVDAEYTVSSSDVSAIEEGNCEYENEKEDLNFVFRDVFGEEYETEINLKIPPNLYESERFQKSENDLTYEDEYYTYRLGVDVSHHQGNINWNKVKEQGYEFAFLRIGYRGYGIEGSIKKDREFENNYKNAIDAGLDVGVYFFSQAINESEAEEEALFVLSVLNGKELQLPIVYDPESILDDKARTDDVTREQFTKNTERFCSLIKESGYKPMIYSNMLWEAFKLDLSVLDYPIWYADYEDKPQTPYHFSCWQYTNTGRVDGISGDTDLNIMLIEKNVVE